MYDHREDGITHINIYSKSQTDLGRLLSNFAFTPFKHPRHGKFNSVEGYWFWLQSKPSFQRESLRILSGAPAKSLGQKLEQKETLLIDEVFKLYIKQALQSKLYTHHKIYKALKESTLPFTHYYVYGNKKVDAGFSWLVDMWEELRTVLHNEEK